MRLEEVVFGAVVLASAGTTVWRLRLARTLTPDPRRAWARQKLLVLLGVAVVGSGAALVARLLGHRAPAEQPAIVLPVAAGATALVALALILWRPRRSAAIDRTALVPWQYWADLQARDPAAAERFLAEHGAQLDATLRTARVARGGERGDMAYRRAVAQQIEQLRGARAWLEQQSAGGAARMVPLELDARLRRLEQERAHQVAST